MDFPNEFILTRKQWQSDRDEAGGKSGMTKVELGPALDDFHKAYKAAQKAKDPTALVKPVDALRKVVTAYIAEVGRKSKDVAKVAEQKILKPLDDLTASLLNAAKEGNKELTKQSAGLENQISMVKASVPQLLKQADILGKAAAKLDEATRRGIDPKQRDTLSKSIPALHKEAVKLDMVAGDLQNEFQTEVSKADPAIQEARKKDLSTARELIRKTRETTVGLMTRTGELQKRLG